jgi:hypothetical protein
MLYESIAAIFKVLHRLYQTTKSDTQYSRVVETNFKTTDYAFFKYCFVLVFLSGPGSSVHIANGYGLDGPGI